MIEYGIDQNYSGTGNDFVFMTSLLHEKIDSHSITFSNIEPLYQGYIGAAHFDGSINMNAPVLNELYAICDSITTVDTNLENKIILAIGIRHKAEEFMLSEIASYANPLQWLDRRRVVTGTSTQYLEYISNHGNQTRGLLNGYQQFGKNEKTMILNEVCIMTPEQIHLNSFMYEPLLDMDITELLGLYSRVKTL